MVGGAAEAGLAGGVGAPGAVAGRALGAGGGRVLVEEDGAGLLGGGRGGGDGARGRCGQGFAGGGAGRLVPGTQEAPFQYRM